MCDDTLKRARYFITTPWISLDVINLTGCLMSPSENHFSKGVKQPVKEKTWQRAGESSFHHSLRGQTWLGPRTEVTRREASTPSKEDLSNRAAQQLNGLLGEVESLEVFKVEKSPL